MKRISVTTLPGLKELAVQHGYEYRDGSGIAEWEDSAYYHFSLRQIETDIESAADQISGMCYQLLDRSLADESVFLRLQIPKRYWAFIADSTKASVSVSKSRSA